MCVCACVIMSDEVCMCVRVPGSVCLQQCVQKVCLCNCDHLEHALRMGFWGTLYMQASVPRDILIKCCVHRHSGCVCIYTCLPVWVCSWMGCIGRDDGEEVKERRMFRSVLMGPTFRSGSSSRE